MRSGILTAVLGLAALGLLTLTAGHARADGVVVTGPGVIVSPGTTYYYPPPVIVAPAYPVYTYPAPVVVGGPTVVVRPYVRVRPILRPRVYVRIR